MKICFLITTFNRSESCRRLVESISSMGDVYILNDGSSQDYSWAEKYNYRRNRKNNGKPGYWHTVTLLWNMVKPHANRYQYFFMIPDDFIPELNFIGKSILTWLKIPYLTKICLNLYVDRGRLHTACWTKFDPVIYPYARKTQWMDMCFMAERGFFDRLQWMVPPRYYNWDANPGNSTGVGAYISRKFHKTGFTMWQTHTSMFIPQHEAYDSKLNPQREPQSQINDYVPGRITAQIASLPDRVDALRRTVESLRPQVDTIFVALNNYTFTPDFLNEGEYIHLDNSTGDAAKFYGVENIKGYLFTADDDLVYPPGYVQFMIEKLHRYNAIVSLHGVKYPRPFVSFRTAVKHVRCLHPYPVDEVLDMGGTGVMCLHTDLIKLKYSDFELPNMADVWVGVIAARQKVIIMGLAHPANYLEYIPPVETIYETEKEKQFSNQNKILSKNFNV